MALTLLHAGGKFGGGGYKVSGGLHGVGVSVVNALSTRLDRRGQEPRPPVAADLPARRPRRRRSSRSARSRRASAPAPRSRCGPREEIFETTTYSLETITNRMRENAFLNKGLEIVIRDERPDGRRPRRRRRGRHRRRRGRPGRRRRHQARRHRRPGARLQVRPRPGRLRRPPQPPQAAGQPDHHLLRGRDARGRGQHMSLEVAMQWNTSFTESVHTFANTINTHEGGTHEEGFRAALTCQSTPGARPGNLIKKREDRVSGDDIREGLTAIISIKLGEPQFEGQTKTKLGNTEAKGFVQRVVNDQLGAWLEQNPAEGRDIVRKAQAAASARMAARKARDLARSPQGPARRRRPARQAVGLPVDQPRGVRGLHRRGRLRRRLGPPGPRPAHPGDPPDPRQDPQRREGPHRQGARQRRGAVDHLRARHRHPRGVRPRQAALPQGGADGRRRRRRPPHQHPAADAAVPVHEAADRGRLRLHGPAAALPAALEQAGRARVRLLRRRARRAAARRAGGRARSCPRRTPSSATRASAR